MVKKLLLFCSLFTLTSDGYSADTLIIEPGYKAVSVGKHLSILEDSSGTFTFAELVAKHGKFRQAREEIPVFANKATYIWSKLTLKNNTGEDLWLDIRNPTTDTILFYQKFGTSIISKLAGDKVPFKNRDILSNNIFFRIRGSRQPTTIYLRFNIRLPRQFPVYVRTSDELFVNGNESFFAAGIFYGLIAVVVIYNLFLWLMIRDRSYLFYSAYIFFSGLLLMHFDGITYAYLWPKYSQLNDHPAILASVPMFFAAFFVSAFLRLRQNDPFLLKGLWIFMITWAGSCVVSLAGYKFLALSISQITAFIAAFYFLLMGIMIYRKGYTPARYFLAGWTILIAGILVFLSKDMGWLTYNTLTSNSLKIGTASEAVLMAFALADRINFYKAERNRLATEKAYEQQQRLKVENELKSAENLLLNYTENLKEKNSLIEKFKGDLKDLELQVKGREAEDIHSEHIEKLLKSIILTEDDWIEFRKLFDKVHQGYIYRIKSTNSNLTETDIRLITLMKLRLNYREMANMLGVTTEAVRKARQRLRKKLKLEDRELEKLIATS